MTDDYFLFDQQPDDDGPIDPDVALISAYLARELSPVQVAAVERRLASDATFCAASQPLIDAWKTPMVSSASPDVLTATATASKIVTRQELDAGWQRYVDTVRMRRGEGIGSRARSAARIAAVVAVIVLPMIGVAQAVAYVRRTLHPSSGDQTGQLRFGGETNPGTPAPPATSVPPTIADQQLARQLRTLPTSREEQPPVVRPIGAIATTSTVPFARVTQVRPLSDGRVLVHDPGSHRVVLLDRALSAPTTVIDSATNGPGRTYGRGPGALLPFAGDSTLFLDASAQAFLVIDPAGHLGRVFAPPVAGGLLTSSSNGIAVYSAARGGVIYGTDVYVHFPTRPPPGSPELRVMLDDSIGVIVANMSTRSLDTVTKTRRGSSLYRVASSSTMLAMGGQITYAVVDEWAAFADGTIGVLRGRDLHLELYEPNGSHVTLPRLPFDWRPISDGVRQQIADSIMAERTQKIKDAMAAAAARARGGSAPVSAAGGGGSDGGDGGGLGAVGVGRPTVSGGSALVSLSDVIPLDLHDLPDYFPAFRRGALRADADGNFWIGLAPPSPGGPDTFMIVNRAGAVIDRVSIPLGSTIVGFGSGVVYLSFADGPSTRLVRARWAR